PVEIYTMDTDDFVKYTGANSYINSEVRKGAISIVATDQGTKIISHRSTLLEPDGHGFSREIPMGGQAPPAGAHLLADETDAPSPVLLIGPEVAHVGWLTPLVRKAIRNWSPDGSLDDE